MNIKSQLQQLCGDTEFLRLNDVNIEPGKIRAIMINEVVPADSDDDFYEKPDSVYLYICQRQSHCSEKPE